MRSRRVFVVAAAWLAVLLTGSARATEPLLLADLSRREIEITTGFTGTDVLLFGTTNMRTGDVVIVVRGPLRGEEVRAKQRVAGIWVNGDAVEFENVPGFYYVASSRPLDEVAKSGIRQQLQIGVDSLRLSTVQPVHPQVEEAYRDGLVRIMQNRRLYATEPNEVTVIGGRLFRSTIRFPTSVPTGRYLVKVYLFRDGVPVSSSETRLIVRRGGLEAAIFRFAHDYSAAYGIVAILLALVAGWLAGFVFRKI